MIRRERQLFRSKVTGRIYFDDKTLDKGLVILRTEDGLGTALVNKETIEIHFIPQPRSTDT
jgi:hypothetical protein